MAGIVAEHLLSKKLITFFAGQKDTLQQIAAEAKNYNDGLENYGSNILLKRQLDKARFSAEKLPRTTADMQKGQPTIPYTDGPTPSPDIKHILELGKMVQEKYAPKLHGLLANLRQGLEQTIGNEAAQAYAFAMLDNQNETNMRILEAREQKRTGKTVLERLDAINHDALEELGKTMKIPGNIILTNGGEINGIKTSQAASTIEHLGRAIRSFKTGNVPTDAQKSTGLQNNFLTRLPTREEFETVCRRDLKGWTDALGKMEQYFKTDNYRQGIEALEAVRDIPPALLIKLARDFEGKERERNQEVALPASPSAGVARPSPSHGNFRS